MSNDLQTNVEYFMMINYMIDYDSFSLCRLMDIFFAMHAVAKELTLSLPRSSIDDLVFSVFPLIFFKLSYKVTLLKMDL